MRALRDAITTATFTIWEAHEKKGTLPAIPHLEKALPALARVQGRLHGVPLIAVLGRRLRDPDEDVHRAAARALGQMGAAAAAHPGLLETLLQWLRDPDEDVRRVAARALGQMGAAAAAHPELLETLLQAMSGPEGFVRSAAAGALGQMGAAAAAHPELLETLLQAMSDPEGSVRSAAAEALAQLLEIKGVQRRAFRRGWRLWRRWEIRSVHELMRDAEKRQKKIQGTG
jgi:HEAT repeat protein